MFSLTDSDLDPRPIGTARLEKKPGTQKLKKLMYFRRKHEKNNISYAGTDIIVYAFFFHRLK